MCGQVARGFAYQVPEVSLFKRRPTEHHSPQATLLDDSGPSKLIHLTLPFTFWPSHRPFPRSHPTRRLRPLKGNPPHSTTPIPAVAPSARSKLPDSTTPAPQSRANPPHYTTPLTALPPSTPTLPPHRPLPLYHLNRPPTPTHVPALLPPIPPSCASSTLKTERHL